MTQKESILEHLKIHKSINPREALDLYGCFRLGAVIFILKDEGHNIKTTINEGKKKYAIYKYIPPKVESVELPLWN